MAFPIHVPSGLTPHWQLIHSILKNSDEDHTQIRMVDANSGLSVRPPLSNPTRAALALPSPGRSLTH